MDKIAAKEWEEMLTSEHAKLPQTPLERQCERVAKMLGLPPDTPIDEVLEASLQWMEQAQGE